MRLDKVIADIASNVKHARVERRTKSYRHSARLTYSRLYAYRRNPNGEVEVVPSEAEIVKLVFSGFADGLTAQEIKRELDRRDLRNRARYRWTTNEIAGLVRPVFAGLIPRRYGAGFKRSAVYQPIVTRSVLQQALKAVKMKAEGFENAASEHCWGGRGWNPPPRAEKGYGIQLSEAILGTADRVAILAESGHGA